jgi:16S rRNA (cytosine1402-N4)-methyltransferase
MDADARTYHEPVLLEETIELLAPQPQEVFLDATVGGGGHSARIAEAIRPGGTLLCMDRDDDAVREATRRLARYSDGCRIIVIRSDFANLEFALDANTETRDFRLDGVLFDLGVSSHQLDAPRGFSFRRTEPLDLRMDSQSAGPTAAQFLAEASKAEIERVVKDYGEPRWAGKIAHRLVERRERGKPVVTTTDLAETVEASIPRAAWPQSIHPATRTFQALRIFLNDEIGQLSAGLDAAVSRLRPGGRIAIISYQSLEDTVVKRAFNALSGKVSSPPGYSPAVFAQRSGPQPILRLLTRKPIVPNARENADNPRARSAKLRAAVRVGEA